MDELTPFRIDVPQADLDDLAHRLDRTRWPDQLPGVGWDYGTPLDYVRELAAYWRTGYDWREHEARLNAFDQFTTAIDGHRVHFMHVRSASPDALPLIITHGWPGSVVEFMNIIGPLTDPAAFGGSPGDAFHLVVPSIPGYGFSGPTRDRGWDVRRVARAWAELMSRLGYARYGAQGGDWGSSISRELGRVAADRVVGVHLNMLVPYVREDDPDDLTAVERARLGALRSFQARGSGYFALQSTKPQTLAYGLTDSPAGQLAWITEKFGEWTDGGLPGSVDRDQLLTNVTVYWLTGTAGSSARLYYETARARAWGPRGGRMSRPEWRSSRVRSRRRSGALPNRPRTSCTGPSSTAAATSRPWRRLSCSWVTCGTSSGRCADRWAGRVLRLGASPGYGGRGGANYDRNRGGSSPAPRPGL